MHNVGENKRKVEVTIFLFNENAMRMKDLKNILVNAIPCLRSNEFLCMGVKSDCY